MKTVCSTGETVPGFDASQWQPDLDFSNRALLGDKFCFIRGAYGTEVDTSFQRHWGSAKVNGLLRGAYTYFLPTGDPIKQAAVLGNLVGRLGKGDLPCVMDWENTQGMANLNDLYEGLSFLTEIELLTGKTPIIYGSPYFLQALSLDTRFSRYPLWVAHYGVKCPLIPDFWKYWTFWQYTSSNNKLDLSLFNGPFYQLEKFAL